MRVLLFGATGMVGQGVLRECLLDPEVESVLAIVRSSTGTTHAKLREVVQKDPAALSAIDDAVAACDACLFCLGISSAGMSEADYSRITFDLTLEVAKALAPHASKMTFLYVSGNGTDSSEAGRSMWARVKGKTENALLRMPFRRAHMFRPGIILPLHGIKSKTRLYSALYTVMSPFNPLMKAAFPKLVTNTELLGKAMLYVAKHGDPKAVLENVDINRVTQLALAAAQSAPA